MLCSYYSIIVAVLSCLKFRITITVILVIVVVQAVRSTQEKKLNDYSLDKVRSYLTVETGKNVRSDELKKDREALQRYIACYKPRTVALMSELLACVSY